MKVSEELTNKKQENASEKYQNISGEEKEKSVNIIVNDIKISLKIKNKD